MSNVNIENINNIVISIPDDFINVRTGETHIVSSKIKNQIEYHMNNNTLIDFIFSALNEFFTPRQKYARSEELLHEISEIKRMINNLSIQPQQSMLLIRPIDTPISSENINLKEVEDVLDAFGG